jgi:hypothetical protein
MQGLNYFWPADCRPSGVWRSAEFTFADRDTEQIHTTLQLIVAVSRDYRGLAEVLTV